MGTHTVFEWLCGQRLTKKREFCILDTRFLKHPTSKASLCYIAFIANEFEDYLIQMQSNEPMIHIMYEKMSSLVFNLMKRFIIRSSLTVCVDGKTKAKQGANLASISFR